MALDWIRSTFLYIRALKNPTHYGFSADLDRRGIEAKLQELCLKNLNALSDIDLIHMDENINIKPTEAGRLMTRFCVAFDTMRQFSNVVGTESLFDLDVVCLDDLDRDSSARIISRTGGGEPLSLNQTKTSTSVHSHGSAATSEQDALFKNASALQIPAVTFDLGNEWDDWEDFDEENLLHAAATLVPQYRTKTEPEIQQCIDGTSGYSTGCAPMFTITTTPLRSISAAASCEIRKLDSSSRPNILCDKTTGKTPEAFVKPLNQTQVNSRLDFFHTADVPSRSDLSLGSSKEEEAFFGIFDGIF
uniref:HFM1, ATP-dependent DNA helicase homolog n=1 Tax=Iconisemion striatum TaxID=60296 RepID=A0A1A7WFU7_9TELE